MTRPCVAYAWIRSGLMRLGAFTAKSPSILSVLHTGIKTLAPSADSPDPSQNRLGDVSPLFVASLGARNQWEVM